MNTRETLKKLIEEREELEEEMTQTFSGYHKSTVVLVSIQRLIAIIIFMAVFLIATFILLAPFSKSIIIISICLIGIAASIILAICLSSSTSALADRVYWRATRKYIKEEQEKIREYRKSIQTEKDLRHQEMPYVAQLRNMTQDVELVRGLIDFSNIDSNWLEEHNGELHHYAVVMWPIFSDTTGGACEYKKYFCTPDGCDDLIVQIMLRRQYYNTETRSNLIKEYRSNQ